MKLYQWDGTSNLITVVFEANPIEVGGLLELGLRERLEALNHRADVEVDSWATPSRIIGVSESGRGTWIATGQYDRDYGFAIACNVGSDQQALADLTQFVTEELKEYDDPPHMAGSGDPASDVTGTTFEPQPGDEFGIPNFVAVQVEQVDGEQAVGWYAYFRSEPTLEDLQAAHHQLHQEKPAHELLDQPESHPNRLSRELGLVRYWIAGVI